MYENDFSIRLAALRQKKGVSARDMSLSLGQNSGYINHIENRQALPSMAVFSTSVNIWKSVRKNFFPQTERILRYFVRLQMI